MPIENPFAVITDVPPLREPTIDELAFDRCLRALTETRPWVLFYGILATITAIMTGIGICLMVGGIILGWKSDVAGFQFAVVLVYACSFILYGLMARFLLRYASRIARARVTQDMEDVADALEQQKSFWKTIGVLSIIWFFLMVVAGMVFLLVQAGL